MKPFAHRALQLITFAALFTIFGAAAVCAQSITAAPDSTGTRVNQSGNQFDITGGTRSGANLYQSFQQFGLNQGQIANFLSNPNIQNILGRVTGGDASVINGLVKVTGGNSNLFLMNPAGIIFGANASLNVPAAFTATTANAIGVGNGWFNAVGNNDYAALTGTPNSFAFLGQPGSIVNAGNLSVGQGQSVTLLGGTVINTGTISAPGGTITVAAVPGGKLVRLSETGSLLSMDLPVASQNAINPATATPLSLPQLLTGTVSTVATGVTVENGVVKLTAAKTPIPTAAGTAIVAGTLTTASTNPSTINVLGNQVGLIAANLDASGTNGGGTILVGGDYKGQGTVPNAQSTYVSPDSVLKADALTSGNGGKVIVWADGNTRFTGTISAKGGVQGGNGGLVETSGKTTLDVNGGRVDASAVNGQAGTWLLDPTDVNIINAGTGTLAGGVFDPPANSDLAPATIQAALDGGTNVNITTSSGTGGNGDITLTDSINQLGGGNASLTFTGRRFDRVGVATISLTSTGGLTFNLNKVNPETNAPSSSIQMAIDAIGTVAIGTVAPTFGNFPGTPTINLGAGTYTGGTEGGSVIVINKPLVLNGDTPATTTITTITLPGGFLIKSRIIEVTGDNVTLNKLTVTGGVTDADGGGIYSTGSNTMISNSVITKNRSDLSGGGGGIYLKGDGGSIFNSTISYNDANTGGGIYLKGGGGYIFNSTIFRNRSFQAGGGIAISSGDIVNSTIVFNQAGSSGTNGSREQAGGGIFGTTNLIVRITDSIVVNNNYDSGNNVGDNIQVGQPEFDGTNLVGDTFSRGEIFTVQRSGRKPIPGNPQIFASADAVNNGGLTPTIALEPGSPAIDASGSSDFTEFTKTDQRGVAAVGKRDIGAYEYVPSPSLPLAGSGSPDLSLLGGDVSEQLSNAIEASIQTISPVDASTQFSDSTEASTQFSDSAETDAQTSDPSDDDLQSKPTRQGAVTSRVGNPVLCVVRAKTRAQLDAYQGVPTCKSK